MVIYIRLFETITMNIELPKKKRRTIFEFDE